MPHMMSDHRRACGGLRKSGMPASSATAAFSANPSGGEIESVDKDGDTTARHRDMLAVEARRAAELMPSPSTRNRAAPRLAPVSEYARSVAIAPSTSNLASERVFPPFMMPRSSSASRSPCIASAMPFSIAPRSAKVIARRAGSPTVRACWRAASRSIPSLDACASGSSVVGLSSVCAAPVPLPSARRRSSPTPACCECTSRATARDSRAVLPPAAGPGRWRRRWVRAAGSGHARRRARVGIATGHRHGGLSRTCTA